MNDSHAVIARLLQEFEGDLKDKTLMVDELRARGNELQRLGLSQAAAALYSMANTENQFYNELVRVVNVVREKGVQLEAEQAVPYPEHSAIRWMSDKKQYEVWDYESKQVYHAMTPTEALSLFGRLGIGTAQFNNAHNQPYRWVQIYPRKTAEERAGEFFGMPELS